MNIVIGLIAFVFMLGVIVLIHEFGHYIAAKKFGVYVREFSLGMGPALWQKQGKETVFSIRAIPFGGYCMMAGEADNVEDEEDQEDWQHDVPEDRWLNHKKTWQQIVVMAAGVCMNFLLAAILYIAIALCQGYVVVSEPVISEVIADTPAETAGLQPGDRITKLEADGDVQTIETQSDVTTFVNLHPGEEVQVTVDRSGQDQILSLTPELDEESNVYLIGFRSSAKAVPIPWYQSIGEGLKTMWNNTTLIFRSFGMLLSGKGFENLSG
ncbi:M50 family metallopeptidase, partial [Faecalibaculum rodentium]